MKAKYINPFLQATAGLFNDFLKISVQAGKPYVNSDSQKLLEVSGIIGLAGETEGAVVISFARDTAINIMSEFAKKKFVALTNEVLDSVGEIVNIIAGNAKKDLEFWRINISLPGVIVGQENKIRWPKGIPVITIPFNCSMGEFSVNVSLKEE